MEYELVEVESMDPKRMFWCVLCDRERQVSGRGVRRRFRVRMRTPEGAEGDYCIVCAARLTGRRQGEFMHAGKTSRARL